jgi:hypothetical protein
VPSKKTSIDFEALPLHGIWVRVILYYTIDKEANKFLYMGLQRVNTGCSVTKINFNIGCNSVCRPYPHVYNVHYFISSSTKLYSMITTHIDLPFPVPHQNDSSSTRFEPLAGRGLVSSQQLSCCSAHVGGRQALPVRWQAPAAGGRCFGLGYITLQ